MAEDDAKKKRNYKNWRYFPHKPSPSFSKLSKRRVAGLCIGCGKDPCECKNPRAKRKG